MKLRGLLPAGTLLIFLFTANAIADEEALDAAIEANFSKVAIVNSNDANWCSYQQKCKYIKRFVCDENSKSGCDSVVQREAAKVGADTFVYEFADMVDTAGNDEFSDSYFYAHGHIYQCSDKLAAVGQIYFADNILRPEERTQLVARTNHQRCGKDDSCQFFRSYACSTSRANPEDRCLKVYRKRSRNNAVNKFVIKKEIRKDGRYHALVDGFKCTFQPVQ